MKPKKLLSFMLAAAMTISMLPTFTLTASADETQTTATEKNITLGTSALSGYDSASNSYKRVYYGTYESSPIKWRILTMNGNDGTYKDQTDKSVDEDNAMFLLSEYALERMAYDDDETKNDNSQGFVSSWRYSDIWQWCNDTFISSSFTNSEKAYLLKTSKGVTQNGKYVDELEDDTFFLLSYDEVNYIQNDRVAKMSDESGLAAFWWLRPPADDYNASCVSDFGSFHDHIVYDTTVAVRPAFNLNLSSVLFTSAAEGKKTNNVGTLSANAENTGNEYKLTMLDSTRSFALTDTSAKTVKTGNTLSLGYSGAKTGSNEYISALIVDDNDEVLYYGQGSKTETSTNTDGIAEGTVTFSIPSDITEGQYTLYVFNEQINGDKETDFSSYFKTVTLNVLPKATFTNAPTKKAGLIYKR